MDITKLLSGDRILEFLEETKDENEIHRPPKTVVPGMYWVKIAENMLNSFESLEGRMLESLDVSFQGRLKYTTNVLEPYVHVKQSEENEGIFIFNFKNKGKNKSIVIAKYGNRDSQIKRIISRLSGSIKTENAKRFEMLYMVPGELQRVGGVNGMYIGQNLEFYGSNGNIDSLDIGKLTRLPEDPRRGELDTVYTDKHKNVIAKGIAKVIPKREKAA